MNQYQFRMTNVTCLYEFLKPAEPDQGPQHWNSE
jgi:hypothetical protein